ncbi:MAG: MtaA/CmuA family methyltransferase [Candidatus Brocadia sp. AMX2]|uniref:Uroporphyrinogen-III decarboxylase n=1 Tax=Candidatus Brocadia sinica JPN1 TaxID=1197129 RepID=A0ABQ0JX16_9BACT|nr:MULTISPECIES: MtaA/CmuA family methyltransferase [Brocadia]KXK30383.1 MAG: methyltransferase [Candidatus Brocadia sinica]MBC6931037.1 MtaA/CmuA family methyltransferase [Candidatus Brocadia sp.]MBL1168186.1 MtaA/CmuA family methyltransferase [Candidatus Brocadia sp. AMX1]NOG40959.1 MtaA/CmuA family methyltransferase [Planctomycetota bacterium]KAA0244296.1 MAG: MtaA/CmuA family methyltransferase [Candidatus Brocadia sp. AMX2]
MTEKERLLKVLCGEKVDRPPVISPGGMMTMASREVMEKTDCRWPAVHRDAEKMATLSIAMHDEAGIENLGIPFCMTVEAEALGGEVEDGDEVTEPRIIHYPLKSAEEWRSLKELNPYKDGRLPVILACTSLLNQRYPDIPVIGNLIGPLSLATSLIDATALFKALRRIPEEVHGMLGFLTDNGIRYGEALIRSGADLIVISDPSATGEILGPNMFDEFALPYLNKMIHRMHALGKPVIVHICGDVSSAYKQIERLATKCISVDSAVNIKEARGSLPGKKLMGNVSTVLLQNGPSDKIQKVSKNLLDFGIDILAPACGLSAKTPVRHIKAMTETAKSV